MTNKLLYILIASLALIVIYQNRSFVSSDTRPAVRKFYFPNLGTLPDQSFPTMEACLKDINEIRNNYKNSTITKPVLDCLPLAG